MILKNGFSSPAARVLSPEQMDHSPPEVTRACLHDLRRINRWLGGHAVLLSLLRRAVPTGEPFTLLDVGAGSGDAGAAVRRHRPEARVISLDRRWLHVSHAHGNRVSADAFQLPFYDRAVDVVMCALFLHHFTDREIVHLLREMSRVSSRNVLVMDLLRHPLAYHFLPSTQWFAGWNDVTVYDGKISVESAFLPHELRDLAHRAGLSHAQVRVHHPWFRISLLAPAAPVLEASRHDEVEDEMREKEEEELQSR
jgi:hypothetical protein